MKVRSVAQVHGKQIDCELDEDDARRFIEGWEELSLLERWRALSRKADELVIEYLARNGDISQEYARQRLMEIRG